MVCGFAVIDLEFDPFGLMWQVAQLPYQADKVVMVSIGCHVVTSYVVSKPLTIFASPSVTASAGRGTPADRSPLTD